MVGTKTFRMVIDSYNTLIQDLVLCFRLQRGFTKSSSNVWDIIVIQSREVVRKSFKELETTTTYDSGTYSTACPCSEIILDAFQIVC